MQCIRRAILVALFSLCGSSAYAAGVITPAATDGGGGPSPLATASVFVGDGRSVSAPSSAIVAVDTGAAGNVTGTVLYAYTETSGGETTLSPQVSITVTNKQVQLTVPPIRRGMVTRRIYRTTNGGSTFKLLYEHDGGTGLMQNIYTDNTLDANLGATAPTANTTVFYSMWLNNGVKYISTHPDQGTNPADLTVLTSTGDGTAGYAMDIYGQVLARTFSGGRSYMSLGHGTTAHFTGYAGSLDMGNTSYSTVFNVGGLGHTSITPTVLTNPSAGDGKSVALTVTGAFGTANTATANAVNLAFTGAGNQAFVQTTLSAFLGDGYTGSAATNALDAVNATASGIARGGRFAASGAAAYSTGIFGYGSPAATTRWFGGFFSDGSDPSSVSAPVSGVKGAALAASNGTGTDDIFTGYDNTDPVFRIGNAGLINVQSPSGSSTASVTITSTSGGGQLKIQTNSGTSAELGSTNNVPLLLKANATTVMTLAPGVATMAGVAFASLGTPANGSFSYCSDCDPQATLTTCTSVGAKTGAFAYRLAGAWKCIG